MNGNGKDSCGVGPCKICGKTDELWWYDRCGGAVCLECAYPDDLRISYGSGEVVP